MPDPNARRDKALETIAREFGQMNDLLKKIERNTRGRTTVPNYLEPKNAAHSDDIQIEGPGPIVP